MTVKKVLILFTLSFLSVTGYIAQHDDSKPWDIGCDTMDTQLDMNMCSLHSYQIADSIMDQLYFDIIQYLEERIRNEITSSVPDVSYQEIIQQQIKLIKKSRSSFKQMRESKSQVIGMEYEGGSIKPLIVNSFALEITIGQINLLEKMKSEIIE